MNLKNTLPPNINSNEESPSDEAERSAKALEVSARTAAALSAKPPPALLVMLETLGATAVLVSVNGVKGFFEYLMLTLKLIWEKSIKIRESLKNTGKYLFVSVASPFVKMSINFHDMKKDLKNKQFEKGTFGAILAFFPYLMRVIFGKRGVAVTLFNYAAPVLSLVFLFNIVSYATNQNFTLKLAINGEFLGYIENEQVFLDAESFVLQRVNYIGSPLIIGEISPEFTITNSWDEQPLTSEQIVNEIFRMEALTPVEAYGFFINGELHGAIRVEDFGLVNDTMNSLLKEAISELPEDEEEREWIDEYDVEAVFLNRVVWDEYDIFLEESLMKPSKIFNMITAKYSDGKPLFPIMVTKTVEYEDVIPYETEYHPDEDRLENLKKVIEEGVDGKKWCEARISYINGEIERENVIKTTVAIAPVTEIINIGTKEPPKGTTVPNQVANSGMFMWPVVLTDGSPTGYISQGFGGGHSGYDIAGHGIYGTPVVAAEDGTVVTAQYDCGAYGHMITIQHDNGLRTLYAHNSEFNEGISVGTRVRQGDVIAFIGSTGRSTGPHCHFEVIDGNTRVNPGNYLSVY